MLVFINYGNSCTFQGNGTRDGTRKAITMQFICKEARKNGFAGLRVADRASMTSGAPAQSAASSGGCRGTLAVSGAPGLAQPSGSGMGYGGIIWTYFILYPPIKFQTDE